MSLICFPLEIENKVYEYLHNLNSIKYRKDIKKIQDFQRYLEMYKLCENIFRTNKNWVDINILKRVNAILVCLRICVFVYSKKEVLCGKAHLEFRKNINKFNKIYGKNIIVLY